MNETQPIFDPTTHYRIKVRGRAAAEWLQSFDGSVKIIVEETNPMENVTVLHATTDQAGILGLVRRLHGLGMTIQQLEIIPR